MKLTRKQVRRIRNQVYQYYPTNIDLHHIFISHLEKPFLYDFNSETLGWLDHFLYDRLTYKFLNELFQQNPELYQKLKSSNLGKLTLIKIIESDAFKETWENAQIVNHYVLDKSTKREYPALMNQEEKVIPLILKTHPELTTQEAKDKFIENNIEIIRKTHWAEKIAQKDRYHLPKEVLEFKEPLYIDKHQTILKYVKKALAQIESTKNLKEYPCVGIRYINENKEDIHNVHRNLKKAMDELSKLGQNAINEYIKANLYRTDKEIKRKLSKYYKANHQDTKPHNGKILSIYSTNDLNRKRTLFLVLKNPLKQDA